MDILAQLRSESFYLLHVLLAFVLGFAIGVERKIRSKEAGMRTHAIVAGGAALMTLVGKYGFAESGDSSRIAAQIVTGIGFLGAGVIMFRRDSLRGVTTAAGIWATAGVGIACGAGMIFLALGTTVLIILLQYLLHIRISFFTTKRFYIYRIKFDCEEGQNENEKIKAVFGVNGYSRINYYNNEKGLSASAEISTKKVLSDEDMKALMLENPFISAFERVYQLDGKE